MTMSLYSLLKADQKTNNIIYNSPHSGVCFPDDFLNQTTVDKHTLLCSGDSYVDTLYSDAPKFGSVLMANQFARSFMDTNRAAYELDQDMFYGDIPNDLIDHSHKVDLGYGSIAKYAYTRKEIYFTKIAFEEAESRIRQYYFPIHEKLSQLLNEDHQKFGYSVLIDCHSMPSYEFLNYRTIKKQPDIIIGNLYGNSCADELSNYIKKYFNKHNLNVTMNNPFAGGYNTNHYGRPNDNKHAIQIEIKKSLYLDEHNRALNEHAKNFKKIITELIQSLNLDIEKILKI